jgi:hypothetical protein
MEKKMMIYVNITLALVAILSLLVNLFLILHNQRNFERNFEAEHRPYVFMEEIDAHFEPGGLSKYDFKVINRGKTPARITSSDYQGEKDKIIGPGQTLIRTYNLDNPKQHIVTVNIYYAGTLDKFKNKQYMSSFKITHTYKQKPAVVFSTFD